MGSIPNIFTWKVGNMRLAQRGERAELRGSGEPRAAGGGGYPRPPQPRGAQGWVRDPRSAPGPSPPAAPPHAGRGVRSSRTSSRTEQEERGCRVSGPAAASRRMSLYGAGRPLRRLRARWCRAPEMPRRGAGGEQEPPPPSLPRGAASENNFLPAVSSSFQLP